MIGIAGLLAVSGILSGGRASLTYLYSEYGIWGGPRELGTVFAVPVRQSPAAKIFFALLATACLALAIAASFRSRRRILAWATLSLSVAAGASALLLEAKTHSLVAGATRYYATGYAELSASLTPAVGLLIVVALLLLLGARSLWRSSEAGATPGLVLVVAVICIVIAVMLTATSVKAPPAPDPSVARALQMTGAENRVFIEMNSALSFCASDCTNLDAAWMNGHQDPHFARIVFVDAVTPSRATDAVTISIAVEPEPGPTGGGGRVGFALMTMSGTCLEMTSNWPDASLFGTTSDAARCTGTDALVNARAEVLVCGGWSVIRSGRPTSGRPSPLVLVEIHRLSRLLALRDGAFRSKVNHGAPDWTLLKPRGSRGDRPAARDRLPGIVGSKNHPPSDLVLRAGHLQERAIHDGMRRSLGELPL
jgi:hypothetical protein